MILDKIFFLLAFILLGFILGFLLSVQFYPIWEVKRLYRSFLKDGYSIGKWIHYRELVDHNYKLIVKPNCEVLYSSSFIKPKKNRYELLIPPTDSFFSITFLDRNTDVIAYITNSDLSANEVTKFEICYQKHQRSKNKRVIALNSKFVWIIARFGIEDSKNSYKVHQLQDKLKLSRTIHLTAPVA